jgi:hypothetical protein
LAPLRGLAKPKQSSLASLASEAGQIKSNHRVAVWLLWRSQINALQKALLLQTV